MNKLNKNAPLKNKSFLVMLRFRLHTIQQNIILIYRVYIILLLHTILYNNSVPFELFIS